MRTLDKLCSRRIRRLLIIGGALLCALLFLRMRFQISRVAGDSMLPALEPGDLLLVDKRAYLGTEPHRGDIVCFRRGGEQLVKRIVGLPGEELEMIEGVIYVNGTLLVEPWLPGRPSLIVSGFISKGTLFESRFAILGDNRVSPLLTETPILPKDQIIGKVVRSFHFGPKHSSIKSTAAKRLSSTKQMH